MGQRRIVGLLAGVLMCASTCAVAQQVVGIPSEKMQPCYAEQEASQWCWAASIQMVMRFHGVNLAQSDIVRKSSGTDPRGRLPDWAASDQVITKNLQGSGVDLDGRRYSVECRFMPRAARPADMVSELRQGRPFIVGYMEGRFLGHAVVVTAATYRPFKTGPRIDAIIVRDPYPGSKAGDGKLMYPGRVLTTAMKGCWFVKVVAEDRKEGK